MATIRVLLIAVLVNLFCAFPAHAQDWDVTATAGNMIYSSRTIEAGSSFELRMAYKDWYAVISNDNLNRYGQWMDIVGGGIGYRWRFHDSLSLYAHIGYYMPQYDTGKCGPEALQYAMNERMGEPWSARDPQPRYVYTLKSSLGAEIGIRANTPRWKGLGAGFSAGYRALRFHELIQGYRADGVAGCMSDETVDFSGYNVGVFVSWEF